MAFTPEQAHKVGEKIGIDWDKVEFDSEALAAGMEVELEHGTKLGDEVNITDDDPDATAKIAWAHLMEAPDYYDFLAAMEEEMKAGTETERERADARTAYQIQKSVDTSKRVEKPQMSPELKQLAKQYFQQVEQAVNKGMSADDAFKKVVPDLDELSADSLVNLMWENQHLGGRGSLQRYKDLLPGLDLFDLMQKVLERTIWEAAIYQWSTTKTKKQTRTPEEQQQAEQRDQEGTKVLQPKRQTTEDSPTKVLNAGAVKSFIYRGHRYQEIRR